MANGNPRSKFKPTIATVAALDELRTAAANGFGVVNNNLQQFADRIAIIEHTLAGLLSDVYYSDDEEPTRKMADDESEDGAPDNDYDIEQAEAATDAEASWEDDGGR